MKKTLALLLALPALAAPVIARIAPIPVMPDGTIVDVRVVVEGQGAATLARAFTFSELAGSVDNYVQYLVPITA